MTSPDIAGLKITDFSKTADTITFGGSEQSATNLGGGSDTFQFSAPGIGVDAITDFKSGLDHVGLSATGFGIAALTDVDFDIGPSLTALADSRPNIIYDTKTGGLYYDAAGGDGKIIQFATLSGHPSLAGSDFVLV